MSSLTHLARYLLILHGLLNIVQGLYSITNPQGWINLAGPLFAGTNEHAVCAIGTTPGPHLTTSAHTNSYQLGLGALGVGWYQFVFSVQNNQALIAATVPLRLVYAAVLWKMGAGGKVVAYEVGVWGVANLAAWPQLLDGRRER